MARYLNPDLRIRPWRTDHKTHERYFSGGHQLLRHRQRQGEWLAGRWLRLLSRFLDRGGKGGELHPLVRLAIRQRRATPARRWPHLSLIHISEPTRLLS